MKTVRRLYFYAVSFISAQVVLWGVVGLLRSMTGREVVDSASALAQALSLILVGAPIFLIHWLWAQRVSAKEEEEKSATLRAVFLYGILLATLIPAAQNVLAIINRALLGAARLSAARAVFGGTQTWSDNLIALAVNALIAAYFWNVLQSEWKTLTEKENFVEVRRLARFLWSLYGLTFVVFGMQQALRYALQLSPAATLGGLGGETAVNAVALLLVGAPVWFFAWQLLQDSLVESCERESLLRLGILYLLTLGSALTVLTSGGELLYAILMQLLGKPQKAADFIQELGVPLSVGVPFAVLWAYYGKWLNRQFEFEEEPARRAGKRRLYFYALALVGLAATTFAAVSLLSLAIDLLTAQTYLAAGGFASPLSSALAFLAAGLPLWLLAWRPLQAQALEASEAGADARRSAIRKTYLYLVLFAAVIGVMVSAGGLIFNLISVALGGGEENSLNAALNALQSLVVFAALLLYHLSALRKDNEFRADEMEAKRKRFVVAVLNHNGKFGAEAQALFSRLAPEISLNVIEADSPPDSLQADALVFSAATLTGGANRPGAPIGSFGGIKIPVEESAAGFVWAQSLAQAVEYSRAAAEGRRLSPPSSKTASAWTWIVYVFAALFALQVLFMLVLFAVSLATGM